MSNTKRIRLQQSAMIGGIGKALFGAKSVAYVEIPIPYMDGEEPRKSTAVFRVRPATQGMAKIALEAGVSAEIINLNQLQEQGMSQAEALDFMAENNRKWLDVFLVVGDPLDDGFLGAPWDSGFVYDDGDPIAWDENRKEELLGGLSQLYDTVMMLMAGSQQAIRRTIKFDEKNSETGSAPAVAPGTKRRSERLSESPKNNESPNS